MVSAGAQAWDGFDYETGTFIEIEKGTLLRRGMEIEYYDYSGGYKTGDVESVSSGEVEVYDHESGEHRTFDMD